MSAAPAEFKVSSETVDGLPVVAVTGELDLAVAPELEAALAAEPVSSSESLLLDLSELAFMDSSGLRVVLLTDERFRQNGKRWAVVIADDSAVERVLSLSQTLERLPAFPTREEALSSLSGGEG